MDEIAVTDAMVIVINVYYEEEAHKCSRTHAYTRTHFTRIHTRLSACTQTHTLTNTHTQAYASYAHV